MFPQNFTLKLNIPVYLEVFGEDSHQSSDIVHGASCSYKAGIEGFQSFLTLLVPSILGEIKARQHPGSRDCVSPAKFLVMIN